MKDRALVDPRLPINPGPFTAVFVALESGRVGAYIEELQETYAEGATMEEAEAALTAELALTLAANRWTTHQNFAGAHVIRREVITITVRDRS